MSSQVQVRQQADAHQPLDCNVVQDLAIAVIDSNEEHRHILAKNGGSFKVGSTWAADLLQEMDLRRRRCTTAAAHLPEDWQHQGQKLMLQVCLSHKLTIPMCGFRCTAGM
jgi:hypothetical protein